MESIKEVDPLRGKVLGTVKRTAIYPGSHYVTEQQQLRRAIGSIREELRAGRTALPSLCESTGCDVVVAEMLGDCVALSASEIAAPAFDATSDDDGYVEFSVARGTHTAMFTAAGYSTGETGHAVDFSKHVIALAPGVKIDAFSIGFGKAIAEIKKIMAERQH